MMTRSWAVLAAIVLGAATAGAEGLGHATFVEGSVSRDDQPLKQGDSVVEGDHLVTGADGRLEVLFDDGSVLRLGKSSDLTVTALSYEPSTQTLRARLHLALGKLWSHVEALQHHGSYEVETDRAVAGVRGTEFRVDASQGAGSIEVYQGRVAVAELIAMRFQPGQSNTAMAMMKTPAAQPSAGGAPAAAAPMAPPPASKAEVQGPARAQPKATADAQHSDAEMQRSIGGTRPEKIVEPNQHLDFGPGGLKVAALRASDDFDAFVKRARPTRGALEHRPAAEKREREKLHGEKHERRRERLERLRWRRH